MLAKRGHERHGAGSNRAKLCSNNWITAIAIPTGTTNRTAGIGTSMLNAAAMAPMLATGGNRVTAEFSGIDTRKIKFAVLTACGVTAALAGMLYAGRLQTGRFQWGQGDESSAIAAVILGGTNLFGGKGSVIGALFGSLLIGLIDNGLTLAGPEASQQEVVRGAIIIAAVALDRRR